MNSRPRRERSVGQSVAEFALVLPVFLMMVFAVLDMGRVVWGTVELNNAAREGARYASVHGGGQVTVCQTGPNLGAAAPAGCPAWTPDSKEPTRVATRNYAFTTGSNVHVYVCYYATTPCADNGDEAGVDNGRGAYVTVKVTTTMNLITPALFGMTGFTLTGQSTVLVNN
jgi:Flp pilus assembly protein TadG